MPTTLKVMSFNIRVENPGDEINRFSRRFHRVVDVIKQEAPDLIGFQEVTDEMRTILRDGIPGYIVQGCGRDRDCHDEAMLIAYRSDRMELISLENRWLSPTPEIPGSTYGGDQSNCPRMFTAALLKHDAMDEPLYFINTHLDHLGENARRLESAQLAAYIAPLPHPFVLTGDFNALPGTPEITLLTTHPAMAARGVRDCTAGFSGTFHDFGRRPPEKALKIDYIFTDAACLESYAVPDHPVNGQYYSDHNAVCACLRF